ncbi:Hypothetical predicted protein, partial [Pelobates cultripes]
RGLSTAKCKYSVWLKECSNLPASQNKLCQDGGHSHPSLTQLIQTSACHHPKHPEEDRLNILMLLGSLGRKGSNITSHQGLTSTSSGQVTASRVQPAAWNNLIGPPVQVPGWVLQKKRCKWLQGLAPTPLYLTQSQ